MPITMEDTALEALKQFWGYDAFRPKQREAVECVLQHQDSVVVLPTGGGKSLCFQLPALMIEGMAVVVSPLIALMKDQVDALVGMGIGAAAINSMITEAERQSIAADIKARRIKLLYVTPERIVQDRFITYLRNNHLSFVAVDEAHCISQWGHDFRPEFRALGILREAFPEAGIHAYTATATPQVRNDIALQLKLRSPTFHSGAFDRPNLIYRVFRRENPTVQAVEVLQRHEGESGIIYCLRRKDVDDLCALLCARGYKALPYHAGMDNASRKRNQEAFIKDEADMIVATVAFGMGIDKPDVRFVLHMGMPKSIEHYQQESGRAGRDGLPSECVLLYGDADYRLWRTFAEKDEGEGAAVAIRKIGLMLDYCKSTQCRHKALTQYFGEQMRVEKCVSCDVCLGEQDTLDNSDAVARTLLQGIQQTSERFGVMYVAKMLCGEKDDRMETYGHTRAPAFGALRMQGVPQVRQWIEQLAEQGFVEMETEYRTLKLTRDGAALVAGRDAPAPKLVGAPAAAPSSRRREQPMLMTRPEEKALFTSLKELRLQLARDEGVPPYLVFGDRTLVSIAVMRPMSLEAFGRVHGVGSIKHEKYGQVFVDHVVAFCEEHQLGAGSRVSVPASPPSGVRREARRLRALEMFRHGASLEEVALEMSRTVRTMTDYLVECVQQGDITDVTPWVSEEDYARIVPLAHKHGFTRAAPIHQELEGAIDYGPIRLVLADLQRKQPALPN